MCFCCCLHESLTIMLLVMTNVRCSINVLCVIYSLPISIMSIIYDVDDKLNVYGFSLS